MGDKFTMTSKEYNGQPHTVPFIIRMVGKRDIYVIPLYVSVF